MAQHDRDLRIQLVDWGEAEPTIKAIRETVFIVEQGVPEGLEWDGLDPFCAHVLAWNDHGAAIGTARMQTNGTIGRMAVLKNWRGRGVGHALLHTLLDLAERQGLSRVTLSAQTHALGFYERVRLPSGRRAVHGRQDSASEDGEGAEYAASRFARSMISLLPLESAPQLPAAG